MEDIEFRQKLRETLETFDARLRQLEHSVNDVIIGSLESAANEYQDNEAYETFKGNYGADIEPMVVPYKALFGEDYDIERALYDDIKKSEGYGSEDFDEAGIMKARIEDLKARLDAVRAREKEIKEEIKEEEEKKDDTSDTVENTKEEDEVSEEQLAEELKEALKEGI